MLGSIFDRLRTLQKKDFARIAPTRRIWPLLPHQHLPKLQQRVSVLSPEKKWCPANIWMTKACWKSGVEAENRIAEDKQN